MQTNRVKSHASRTLRPLSRIIENVEPVEVEEAIEAIEKAEVKEAATDGVAKEPVLKVLPRPSSAKSPGRTQRPLRPLKTSRSSRSSKHTRVAQGEIAVQSIPESLRKAAGDVEVKEAVREQPGQRSC